MMNPELLMRSAIASCRQGLAAGQSPFGCAIALGDQIVASAHNTVVLSTDITAHAEVNAIRAANKASSSVWLTGAIVATTCEPCPMCTAALHWARVEKVYYGASIEDAAQAGFNELHFSAEQLLEQGGSSVKLVGGVLADDCRELFTEWTSNPHRVPY